MRAVVVAALVAASSMASSSQARADSSLAVVATSKTNVSATEANLVLDALAAELETRFEVRALERSEVQRRRPASLDTRCRLDTQCLRRLVGVLASDHVVLVAMVRVGTSLSLELTYLDAASTGQLDRGKVVIDTGGDVRAQLRPVAARVLPESLRRKAVDAGSSSQRLTGLIVGGTGIAVLAAGVFFALDARSIESEINDAARAGEPWSEDLADRDSRGERSEVLGISFLAVGGAAVITGGVLYWLGRGADPETPRVGIIAGGEQTWVTLGGRF